MSHYHYIQANWNHVKESARKSIRSLQSFLSSVSKENLKEYQALIKNAEIEIEQIEQTAKRGSNYQESTNSIQKVLEGSIYQLEKIRLETVEKIRIIEEKTNDLFLRPDLQYFFEYSPKSKSQLTEFLNTIKKQDKPLEILQQDFHTIEQEIFNLYTGYQKLDIEHISYLNLLVTELNKIEQEGKVLSTYHTDLQSIKKEIEIAIENPSYIQRKNIEKEVQVQIQKFHTLQSFIDKLNPIQEERRAILQKTENPSLNYRNDIDTFYSFIKKQDRIDSQQEQLYKESFDHISLQRLQIIRENFSILYSTCKEKVVQTNVYKRLLFFLQEELKSNEVALTLEDQYYEVLNEIESLLSEKQIDKEKFNLVRERAESIFNRKNGTIKHIQSSLREMGYIVIDESEDTFLQRLSKGETIYLDTKDTDYKILCKWKESGEWITRLVRFVETEIEKNNTTSYQKQKDKEKAIEWCKEYNVFLQRLKELDIPIEILQKAEPEEQEVVVLVNKNKTYINKRQTEHSNQQQRIG